MVELEISETAFWVIIIWVSFWAVSGVFRIMSPYYSLKRYASGQWKMPHDISGRIGGLISLGIAIYILNYLWSYFP